MPAVNGKSLAQNRPCGDHAQSCFITAFESECSPATCSAGCCCSAATHKLFQMIHTGVFHRVHDVKLLSGVFLRVHYIILLSGVFLRVHDVILLASSLLPCHWPHGCILTFQHHFPLVTSFQYLDVFWMMRDVFTVWGVLFWQEADMNLRPITPSGGASINPLNVDRLSMTLSSRW